MGPQGHSSTSYSTITRAHTTLSHLTRSMSGLDLCHEVFRSWLGLHGTGDLPKLPFPTVCSLACVWMLRQVGLLFISCTHPSKTIQDKVSGEMELEEKFVLVPNQLKSLHLCTYKICL